YCIGLDRVSSDQGLVGPGVWTAAYCRVLIVAHKKTLPLIVQRFSFGAGISRGAYFRWPLTNLVSSNIDTCSLPNKGRSLSSALILRRFLGSCRSCFLMYSQIFLVTSVRGSGSEPITAARVALGVRGFMKAALGLRAVFCDVAIERGS